MRWFETVLGLEETRRRDTCNTTQRRPEMTAENNSRNCTGRAGVWLCVYMWSVQQTDKRITVSKRVHRRTWTRRYMCYAPRTSRQDSRDKQHFWKMKQELGASEFGREATEDWLCVFWQTWDLAVRNEGHDVTVLNEWDTMWTVGDTMGYSRTFPVEVPQEC